MDYNEAMKNSRCFGVAYDSGVKECKVCEVNKLCKQRTEGAVPASKPAAPVSPSKEVDSDVASTPRPQPKTEPAKPAKKTADKPSKEYAADMPDFKPMELDELCKLAKGRGIDMTSIEAQPDPKIQRMRVIMALKKSYEK